MDWPYQHWVYEQISGKLYAPPGIVVVEPQLVGIGYSGQPPHRNIPGDEGLVNLGPIPSGTWKRVSLQAEGSSHGPFVITVVPNDDVTRQRVLDYGRDPSTFRMHGDLITNPGYGSDGCIIQSRDVREIFWASNDPVLEVVGQLDPSPSSGGGTGGSGNSIGG